MAAASINRIRTFSPEALALRIAARFPLHLRWYAKHLVLALGDHTGPELCHLTPKTTLDEILDWTEYRLDSVRLEHLLDLSLPFEVELGDPLDAAEVTFSDVVTMTYDRAFASVERSLVEPK